MRTVALLCGALTVLAFSTAGIVAQASGTVSDKKIIAEFEKNAKQYVALREREHRRVGKLPANATPEQMQAQKMAFQEAVRMARANARAGELFTPDTVTLFRELIKVDFVGWERNDLRKTVLEADTSGVPLKVNNSYPDTKELVQMSPALLLTLPQLPEQLRYRFIGTSLAILDRDNALIIDFMPGALP